MESYGPAIRAAALMFAFLIISGSNSAAQTLGPPTLVIPLPQQPTGQAPPRKKSLERNFFKNILHDQAVIWTSPLRLRSSDAVWLAPLVGGTATLIATDHDTGGEFLEFSANPTRTSISNAISEIGSGYATAGICGAFYVFGRIDHNDQSRETGLLAAEALIDSAIVGQVLKEITQRPRPHSAKDAGEFFTGGSSFPSGHSLAAWSVATVIAMEYHKHLWVQILAYTLAATVSASRVTGSNHFISDALIGSAIGFATGRYVYHTRHDPTLDDPTNRTPWIVKLIPRVTPKLGATTQGISATWSF